MRQVISKVFYIIFVISACHQPLTDSTATPTTDSAKLAPLPGQRRTDAEKSVSNSQFAALINQFTTWSGDTLHGYAQINQNNYKFNGSKLDSESIELLRTATGDKHSDVSEYFSISRIALSPNVLGLVCRVPGEYSTTSIMLYLADLQKQKITGRHELADLFGDEGYLSETQSWIFPKAHNSDEYQCFTWQWRSEQLRPEKLADTVRRYQNHYYLVRFQQAKPDTVESNTPLLVTRYKHWLVPGPGGMQALGLKN